MRHFSAILRSAPVVVSGLAISLLAFCWVYLHSELPIAEPPKDMIGCNFAARSDCFATKGDREWNESLLSRFNEKPLVSHGNDISYRLILQPTFHPPIAIRIVSVGESKSVTVKRFDGLGGFGYREWGKMSFESTKPLVDSDWEKIMTRIKEAEFWNTSPYTDEDPVTDGAVWYFEGNEDGRKNFVRRITPGPELKALFLSFLEVAGESDRYDGY